MLKTMRQNSNSFVFKAFLTLIALSFVLWGIGEYATGGMSTTAIEVNGENISVYEIAREYEQQKSFIENQLGEQLSSEMLEQMGIGHRVLLQFIQKETLSQFADSIGLAAPEAAIRQSIMMNESFFDETGQFNPQLYRNTVANRGMKIADFEKRMGDAIRNSLIMAPVGINALHGNNIIAEMVAARNQAVNIDYIHVPSSSANITQPSEEDIRAHYEATLDAWMTPEQHTVQMLALTAEAMGKAVDVTEQEIQAYYRENQDQFIQPEKREARHILVASRDEAAALVQQLQDGADFAALARAHSLDSATAEDGGSLGLLTYSDTVTSFAEQLFDMEPGTVNGPINTPFGYHVIELLSVQPERPQTTAEYTPAIRTFLKQEKLSSLQTNLREELQDAIAGGVEFDELAQKAGVPPRAMTLDINAPDEALPAEVYITLGTLQAGDKAYVEDENGVPYVVYLETITPATAKPYNTVKEDVADALIEKLRQEALLSKGNEVRRKIAATENNDMQASGYSVRSAKDMRANGDNAPAWLKETGALQSIFKAGVTALSPVLLAEDGAYIAKVVSKQTAQLNPAELQAQEDMLLREIQNDLQWQILLALHNDANIDLHPARLSQVMPGEPIYTEVLTGKQ